VSIYHLRNVAQGDIVWLDCKASKGVSPNDLSFVFRGHLGMYESWADSHRFALSEPGADLNKLQAAQVQVELVRLDKKIAVIRLQHRANQDKSFVMVNPANIHQFYGSQFTPMVPVALPAPAIEEEACPPSSS
jgi:hypothetical protein